MRNGQRATNPATDQTPSLGTAILHTITLLLMPVLYAIFVKDLRILKWETKEVALLPAVAGVAAD